MIGSHVVDAVLFLKYVVVKNEEFAIFRGRKTLGEHDERSARGIPSKKHYYKHYGLPESYKIPKIPFFDTTTILRPSSESHNFINSINYVFSSAGSYGRLNCLFGYGNAGLLICVHLFYLNLIRAQWL